LKTKKRYMGFKIGKWIAIILIGVIASACLFVLAVNFEIFGHLYSQKELKSFKNETATRVFSSDGEIIGQYFATNRTNVTFDQLPDYLVNALVATEDARYFEHKGVDSRSLIRVLIKTILLNKKSAGGGSTITQQLLKNMYGRKSFGPLTIVVNKTKEALIAQRLEEVYTKEEILALYLNTVPFGENVYGIESASRLFYNKSVQDLTLDESAVLVGMLKANTFYNPRLYPSHAKSRRNVVFKQMVKYGYLSEREKESLSLLAIKLDYANLASSGPANYFLVQVKNELSSILENIKKTTGNSWDYRTDGLQVETTLNSEMHGYALEAFRVHLGKMQKLLRKQYESGSSNAEIKRMIRDVINQKGLSIKTVSKQEIFSWDGIYSDSISVADSIRLALTTLQAGFLAVNPNSGEILSWVGGIDFRTQPYDQVLAKRQLASTFKPVLYAAALEKGISPCDYLSNTARVFTDQGNWKVSNYDHSEGGEYSVNGALMLSKNIPAVDLLFKVGFDEVDYLWRKMGFSVNLEYVPAMALGIADASIYELAMAYASFANGGNKIKFHCINKVTDARGNVIYERMSLPETEKIMASRTAILMNEMLQNAINKGTGTAIRNTYGITTQLAGKTGTSQNFGDAWFAAYNPNLVMVTRVGASYRNVHFNSGRNGSGGRLALPLVGLTLQKVAESIVLQKTYSKNFPKPNKQLRLELDCQNFEADNTMDKIKGLFYKKSTTAEQSQKKQESKKSRSENKKRKGWFKKK
jgi:penicillin-binding protein 1A